MHFAISQSARNRIQLLEALTGYSIQTNYLGHGSQGVVFQYSPTQVIKLTSSPTEWEAAAWLLKNEHPNLPRVFDLIPHSRGYKAIIREPLDHLEMSFQSSLELGAALKALEKVLPTKFKLYKPSKVWTSDVLHNLTGPEALYFEKIQGLANYLIAQKIVLKDLYLFNFGLRNGELVLRDTGCLKV